MVRAPAAKSSLRRADMRIRPRNYGSKLWRQRRPRRAVERRTIRLDRRRRYPVRTLPRTHLERPVLLGALPSHPRAAARSPCGLARFRLGAGAAGLGKRRSGRGLSPRDMPGRNRGRLGTQAGRRTEWREQSPGTYFGIGQRVLVTEAGETALLDMREIELAPSSNDERAAPRQPPWPS